MHNSTYLLAQRLCWKITSGTVHHVIIAITLSTLLCPPLLPFCPPFSAPFCPSAPPLMEPVEAFQSRRMLADDTKEHAEDVISPTSKAKPAESRKGRHTRSHSASLDWMYAGRQAGAHMPDAGSADTEGHDSAANPHSVSAAAIEKMYGITPVTAA